MSKHTPGPWELGASGRVFTREDGLLTDICQVHGQDVERRWIPNAKLISAAPDLLEACRKMMAAWESAIDIEEDDAIEAIRAAIARATP